VAALVAFLTTEPWATLLLLGAAYIVSIPLSIRSYLRLRRAAEQLRAAPPPTAAEVAPGEHSGP
jgi:CDP-diacylglycerol---serine O-phosphatidyltransferase